MIFSTIDHYIAQVVRPSLGEYADDYDVRAIAQEMTEWQDEITPSGDINLNHSGFIERKGINFWDIAAKHETH